MMDPGRICTRMMHQYKGHEHMVYQYKGCMMRQRMARQYVVQ